MDNIIIISGDIPEKANIIFINNNTYQSTNEGYLRDCEFVSRQLLPFGRFFQKKISKCISHVGASEGVSGISYHNGFVIFVFLELTFFIFLIFWGLPDKSIIHRKFSQSLCPRFLDICVTDPARGFKVTVCKDTGEIFLDMFFGLATSLRYLTITLERK